MIKIGLIGAGFMGTTHSLCYEALHGQTEFRVTAVSDLDEQAARKLATKFGADVYSSAQDMIDHADINTVDICVPTFLHSRYAIKAMRAGYDVFIEKPVCLHESEAEELLRVQLETGARVMVGHCLRFWPEYVYLKRLKDEAPYGRLISAVLKRISPLPTWNWEQWPHDVTRSGSVALDLHIHDVDFIRYLLGQPDSVKSEALSIDERIEHIFSLYAYDGAIASMEGTWYYPSSMPFEMEYRVKFENATVLYNSSSSPSLRVYLEDGDMFVPELDNGIQTSNTESGGNISSLAGYYNTLKYFLGRLAEGKSIDNASLKDGVESFLLTKREIEAAGK